MSFTPQERAQLLVAPRIGPIVLDRLEQAGLDSIAKLSAVGVDAAVEMVCARVKNLSWNNRRSALRQALESVATPRQLEC